MVLPNTIPLLMGRGYDDTVSKILQEPDNHLQNIVRISQICRVKITFHCSQSFPITRRKRVSDVLEYVFPQFFTINGNLYYMMKRGGRSGFMLPMDKIRSYEPVIGTTNEFKSYEDFRKQFDTYFITEEEIKSLWEGTSPQHGGKYLPSDFKPLGKAGKQALQLFLPKFQGVDNMNTDTYTHRSVDGSSYWTARGNYYGTGGSSTSRDISISHQLGRPCVHYASEYSGTGNGRYGLLVSRSKYLWVEDD